MTIPQVAENLDKLFGLYLYEDWHFEYGGSWETALDDFADSEPARVQGAQEEIHQLLADTDDEAQLGRALDGLGNARDPGDGPHAYRDWLEAIAARLQEHLS